ncbi:alpha-hydroxy acid oxidase [Streptomyces sp. 4N509B]|uniref:alpha-hydroxy acid oxidase n=1 Tax=Streptomyces sp. 4N509B TaxID=3457413 RepID=UPI003FD3A510
MPLSMPPMPESTPDAALTVREFRSAARAVLDPLHADYVVGGIEEEHSPRDNEAVFSRLRLLPRVLRGNARRESAVTLLGTRASMPILLAPTAYHRLAHPEGELASARAAAAAGTIMMVSMAATAPVDAIAEAARAADGGGEAEGASLWFQLYIQPELEITEALVRRAADAGCTALVVTVDPPAPGGTLPCPLRGAGEPPPGLACENMRGLLPGDDPGRVRPIVVSSEISWWHLHWLRQLTSLPILLKGLLHPEDVRLALAHGVDGLVLSHQGGRESDDVPATLELLPEVAAIVGGRIPIILDGGVRRGSDVVKALALGATAVAVGRPVLWGLACGGEAGVRRVLELLRGEFDDALTLCGAGGPHELTPDLVRPATPGLTAPWPP